MIDLLTNESFLFLLIVSIMAALGMNIVYATGQLNLGQAGFMAIGAYTAAVTDNVLDWPLAASLLAGAGMSGLVALPVAWGANRIRGVYLIMGTLAVGELVRITIGNVDSLGGLQGYHGITPVTLAEAMLVLILTILFTTLLLGSPAGLQMRVIFDDEDAAAAAGVATRRMKITSVVISAAVVGLAGGLMAKWLLFIAPRNFGLELSFRIALFTLIGGVHSVFGAIFGAFFVTYLLEVLRVIGGNEDLPEWIRILGPWRQVIYGILIMVLMVVRPEGLVSRQWDLWLTRPFRALRRRRTNLSKPAGAIHSLRVENSQTPTNPDQVKDEGETLLVIEDVSHSFDGLMALNNVSLVVKSGEILALIGANGAGKTTLAHVVSGYYSLQTGTMRLKDHDLSTLPADQRVKAGLARTFQSVRMFAHLTVEENLRLGLQSAGEPDKPDIEGLLRLIQLEGKLDALPEQLTLAGRRRLEIGRAVASAPLVIFLDEPSVGMNEVERQELAVLIRQVRANGTAVVLIDHNLDLALGLADRVAVLDFGSLLTVGTPQEVIADERVRRAYLGSTEAPSSVLTLVNI